VTPRKFDRYTVLAAIGIAAAYLLIAFGGGGTRRPGVPRDAHHYPPTFPGKQPDPVPGQIGLDESFLSVYVCKDAIKAGDPAITVFDNERLEVVERVREWQVDRNWWLTQHDEPQPCGATVVLEWRKNAAD
jgi:hypothetical protein